MAGIALVVKVECWIPFSEQNWTRDRGVYSLKTPGLDVSTIYLPLMSARDCIALLSKIVGQFHLHLECRIIRHRVKMRIEFRH